MRSCHGYAIELENLDCGHPVVAEFPPSVGTLYAQSEYPDHLFYWLFPFASGALPKGIWPLPAPGSKGFKAKMTHGLRLDQDLPLPRSRGLSYTLFRSQESKEKSYGCYKNFSKLLTCGRCIGIIGNCSVRPILFRVTLVGRRFKIHETRRLRATFPKMGILALPGPTVL
jgi:hypothetical protein